MQQGEKKTLFYTGITIIGLLLSIIMVGGLHNKLPQNEEKTAPDSLADETPADEQPINTLHPPSTNPAKPASTTLEDKNPQTSSPHTADAPNKNHVHKRQGFSYLRQACIVVIKLIVVIVLIVAIGVIIISELCDQNGLDDSDQEPSEAIDDLAEIVECFNNAYGCRTSYDNLVLSRAEQDYYALLPINAATIGYGREGDHSLSQVVHKLAAIAKDRRNKGLFIVLYNEKKAYSNNDLMMGHCLTLVSAIEAYKQKTGRTVIAYGETFMPEHYFVATGADKIYLAQTGTLTIPAPAVFQLYALQNVHKQQLNHKARLKVAKEDNELVVGKYKLTPCKNDEKDNFKKCYQDPYIQRLSKRKASIQAKNYWLKNCYNSAVANCTKILLFFPNWSSATNLEHMSIKSQDAYRMGFVDFCCEKQTIIPNQLGYPVQKCAVYFRLLSLDAKWALIQQPAIEVVFIEGDIDELLEARIAPLLTLLVKAAQVKGLMLVIDSPGGDADSGKAISTMVKTLKAAGKVVFAYTEGLCCSAAYRIGCTAHKMFARETAWIGSIGTRWAVNPTKENEDDLRSWGQEFIDYVASCRAESLHASQEDLAKMVLGTEARTFDGQRAKDLQLIDEIGTLDTTIAAMKSTLGCPNIKVFYREHCHA